MFFIFEEGFDTIPSNTSALHFHFCTLLVVCWFLCYYFYYSATTLIRAHLVSLCMEKRGQSPEDIFGSIPHFGSIPQNSGSQTLLGAKIDRMFD